MPEETDDVTHGEQFGNMLLQLEQLRRAHADVLAQYPEIDAYWHAGQQLISAIMAIRSAVQIIQTIPPGVR